MPTNLSATSETRNRNTANVVGISAGYHDSACCLIQDGRLIAAAQEERFSRLKNDKAFPIRAFRYCLNEAHISIADVDCIAFYENPQTKLARQIWMSMTTDLSEARRDAILDSVTREQPEDVIRRILGYEGRIETSEHHLSHAASSYYFSGFEDAAILTVDGVGEWATTTYASASGSTINTFEQVSFPDSLGFLYSAITGYLGFEVNEGEYKVMGLAPYGSPKYVKQLGDMIESIPGTGQYRLNLKYFGFLHEDSMYSDELSALLGHPPREAESEIRQFHKDVANSIQSVLEDVMVQKVLYLHSKVPSENLCLAGGVALNVVANRRCIEKSPFRRLFVQPAAGDAGGAVGAAAVAHLRLTGQPTSRERLRHAYLGPSNSTLEIFQILKSSSAKFQDFRGRENDLIQETVAYLLDGAVVGWSQGRMEFGPRALGARSILADPRRPEMRDRINSLVKQRESFRPFAPAVLEAHAKEHFAIDHASPFMLETCQVTSTIPLPAVTHVDRSARIQTVDSDSNPRFAALLAEFYRCTGCPILLNTSFNMRGEPIVCTCVDAIMCFVRSRVDVLVLDDFVLTREGIPMLFEFEAQQRALASSRGDAVTHRVYTLL